MSEPLFAFVHIGKTAGTSVHNALRSTYGISYLVTSSMRRSSTYRLAQAASHLTSWDLRWLRRISPTLKGVGGHNVRPYVDLGEAVRYATFFRDPVARSISAFAEHDKFENFADPIDDFRRWLEIPRFRNEQCRVVSGRESAEEAIAAIDTLRISYGMQTDLPGDAARVFGAIGVPIAELHHANASTGRARDLANLLRSSDKALEAACAANCEDLRLLEMLQSRPQVKPATQLRGFASGSEARYRLAMGHRLLLQKPLEAALQRQY